MSKLEQKVDKRSKEYRDAHKKLHKSLEKDLGKVVLTQTTSAQTITLPEPAILTSTTKDLQKQIDKLSARISQLKTKVG
jgi:hypothetical protein